MLLMLAALLAAGLWGSPLPVQAAQPDDVAEIRHTVAAARKEIDAYKAAGRAPSAPDHPALKWDAVLWAARDRFAGTDAAAIASAEAIRLLVRAELWDRADARVDSLVPDDTAWERVPAVVYEEAIARKDLRGTIDRLTRIAGATSKPSNRAAAMLVVGRAWRREGDKAAAIQALGVAQAVAPGTPLAEEASGVIYEIEHLSPGLAAPAVSGRARHGRAVDLNSYRGKAVVLVFWGTT
jgi:hypothetical protein